MFVLPLFSLQTKIAANHKLDVMDGNIGDFKLRLKKGENCVQSVHTNVA